MWKNEGCGACTAKRNPAKLLRLAEAQEEADPDTHSCTHTRRADGTPSLGRLVGNVATRHRCDGGKNGGMIEAIHMFNNKCRTWRDRDILT